MYKKEFSLLLFLLCLLLSASTLYAGRTIYLAQDGVGTDVNLNKYLSTGVVELTASGFAGTLKVQPGPAPLPYPSVKIWEKAIEQLGPTSTTCDGIQFVNGNLWVVHKKALVLWKIRVPQAFLRLASEFERDLTMSFWVDWNQDNKWGKNERMIGLPINLHQYFPSNQDYVEIQYLSYFWVPSDAGFFRMAQGGSSGAANASKKLWVRGALSYDDPDLSPEGQCLFGETEDYLVTYYNQKDKDQKAKQ